MAERFALRRNDARERPPQTWVQQLAAANIKGKTVGYSGLVASKFAQETKRTDQPIRFRRLDDKEKKSLDGRGQELDRARSERVNSEVRPVVKTEPKPAHSEGPKPLSGDTGRSNDKNTGKPANHETGQPPAKETVKEPARKQDKPAVKETVRQADLPKARIPKTSIVGKPPSQLGKAGPPTIPQPPKPDLKVAPHPRTVKVEPKPGASGPVGKDDKRH